MPWYEQDGIDAMCESERRVGFLAGLIAGAVAATVVAVLVVWLRF